MTTEHLPLSIGVPPGQRALAAVAALLFAAGGLGFVLLPVSGDGLLRRLTGIDGGAASYESARDLPPGLRPPDLGDTPSEAGPGFALIGLCGVPFVLLGLYLALRVLRTAAWLDGTRLRVRGALGTRTVDLATADVAAGVAPVRAVEDGSLHRVPTLVARDPDTGRRVILPLRGAGLATLPPHELRALAGALTTGRPTDGRDGDVHALAGRLRAMADDPFGT